MGKGTCEVCGYESELGATVMHCIVPKEFTEQAGIPDSASVVLCVNCRDEVRTWYANKVFSMTYDPVPKRFRPRSPAEMVKEYETAYKAFTEYKKRLRSMT